MLLLLFVVLSMYWFYVWWQSQSAQIKAAVIGALVGVIATALVSFGIWLLFSIPKIIAWKYKRVLLDMEEAEKDVREDLRKDSAAPTMPRLSAVIERSGHSEWIALRARKWKKIKEAFPYEKFG